MSHASRQRVARLPYTVLITCCCFAVFTEYDVAADYGQDQVRVLFLTLSVVSVKRYT